VSRSFFLFCIITKLGDASRLSCSISQHIDVGLVMSPFMAFLF